MRGLPSPFGGGAADFDAYDAFVPAHLPEPGPFLEDQDVLSGRDHAAFHRLTRSLFEARGVYDATFDYNLARLNLDARHPDGGYRYAREAGDPATLRAEFTPTTPFCPQSRALTLGSWRAWNVLADRHEYDRVRVRVHPMHHAADAINDSLAELSAQPGDALEEPLDDAVADATNGPSGETTNPSSGDATDDEPAPF